MPSFTVQLLSLSFDVAYPSTPSVELPCNLDAAHITSEYHHDICDVHGKTCF
jgi:hypothetical protein